MSVCSKGCSKAGAKLCLWTLSGDRAGGPTLVRGDGVVQPDDFPGLASQPAPGADDIEMANARVQNAAYTSNHVYFTLNDLGSGQTGYYVGKFNVNTLTEARNITSYIAGLHLYYPNLTLLGPSWNPMVVVAMSYSGNEDYISGGVKLFENFQVNSDGVFWGVAEGSATYNAYDSGGRNRWGDYVGAVRDFSCDTAWTVTQFAPALDTWGTQISAIAGPTVLGGICNLIFDDGFERGSHANWSAP